MSPVRFERIGLRLQTFLRRLSLGSLVCVCWGRNTKEKISTTYFKKL